jgi:hypothetical protein
MMNRSARGALRALAASVAASAALALPLVASAQPTYARAPSYAHQEDQIQGRVVSFDGQFALQVHDSRGYVDNVRLHQGTVINPTGLTLRPGMAVSIMGVGRGGVFEANEIDTPYTYAAGYPYGPYYGYPYYGYGPSIGIGFGFGGGRHWR